MLRIKDLQNELTEARAQIEKLITENRISKMIERRQEKALAKYEGTHAKLPQVIKSYSEDLRSLQTRLRRMKSSYRELENKYRLQNTELLSVHKQHKHLLDLTKNKQLGEREKLSNQLEEAENTIKDQEKKIQNLIKKLELQKKSHLNQIKSEVNKTKLLQTKLCHMKEMNDKLESQVERIRYQSYGGRKSSVCPVNRNKTTSLGSKAHSTNSLLDHADCGDQRYRGSRVASTKSKKKSLKSELIHGDSEISDHTKDMQKNLMKQVHEDVISQPNMLVNEESDNTSDFINDPWIVHEISEIMKLTNLLNESEGSLTKKTELIIADNPFSLSETFELTTLKQCQSSNSLDIENEVVNNVDKSSTSKSPKETDEQLSNDKDDVSCRFSVDYTY